MSRVRDYRSKVGTSTPLSANGERSRTIGFSLIEVVIAMALLTIGLVGVLKLFPVGLKASHKAELMSKITIVAQKRLEEIKLAGFNALTLTPPPFPLEGLDGKFKWRMTILEPDLEGLYKPNEVRYVSVTVELSDGGKKTSKEFATYITK